MPLSIDPTLRDLNDCGCCAGITAATPAAVTNRPGLSAVTYRIGEHATFKASMLAALSATENAQMQALKTRAADDFTIALTDAWAAALDVLTFYQERIANESYLRTATERLSVLNLARLIGYELRPGVAASTALAFTLDETAGSPTALTLAAGLKVQSIPGPDEQPQTFETVEPIAARPRWNAIRPRQTAPQTLGAGMGALWLTGTDANLRPGDRLLIVGAKSGGGHEAGLRRVQAVDKDDLNKRTQVTFELLDYGPTPVTADAPGVWVLRARPAAFGHNAPKKSVAKTIANPDGVEEWGLDSADSADLKRLTLDAVYDQIVVGGWVVVDRPASAWTVIDFDYFKMPAISFFSNKVAATAKLAAEPVLGLALELGTPFLNILLNSHREQTFAHVKTVAALSRASYGITGRVTQLTLDAAWLRAGDDSLSVLRDVAVYAQSEALTPAEAPLDEKLPANDIVLNDDYAELLPGQAVVFTGQLAGSAKDSPRVNELAEIKSVATTGGFTQLTLANNLTNSFRREATTINANVAPATHGETVSEVLGSGNGSQPYQHFALRQTPLTYVSAQTPSGAASTLQMRVNDLLWHEAATLFGLRTAGSGLHDPRRR